MRITAVVAATLAATLSLTTLAVAGPTPAERCESTQNKIAGKFASCRQSEIAKSIKTGDAADFTKCEEKFGASWDKAVGAAEGACTTLADKPAMQSFVAVHATVVAAALDGGDLPTCGDDTVNVVGEQCDGADLGGTDCIELGHNSGDLGCNSSCRFDSADCSDCPAGSEPMGGYCWALAAVHTEVAGGITCDEACAALGTTCNEPGTQSVGSAGTLAACQAMADYLVPADAPHVTSDIDATPFGPGADWAVGCLLTAPLPPATLTQAHRILHTGSPTLCSAGEYGGGVVSGAGLINRRICACDRP